MKLIKYNPNCHIFIHPDLPALNKKRGFHFWATPKESEKGLLRIVRAFLIIEDSDDFEKIRNKFLTVCKFTNHQDPLWDGDNYEVGYYYLSEIQDCIIPLSKEDLYITNLAFPSLILEEDKDGTLFDKYVYN